MDQTHRPVAVMGVLNVTPDSFSDGGQHFDAERAIARGLEMAAQGASVIDVGGESTRPGAQPVDSLGEQQRVIPVIEGLVDEMRRTGAQRNVRVSVDTRNPDTARAAVRAGADLLNDVSAALWPVAADLGVGWVAMHMLGDPRTMQDAPNYGDVVTEVAHFLTTRAELAVAAGVQEVWIDPGIGFGKTTVHNLELLANLDRLIETGFPVLVGTSRKRFLGELAGCADRMVDGTATSTTVDDRLEGSVATAVWSMVNGAQMIRVHDVAETVAAATLFAETWSGR